MNYYEIICIIARDKNNPFIGKGEILKALESFLIWKGLSIQIDSKAFGKAFQEFKQSGGKIFKPLYA